MTPEMWQRAKEVLADVQELEPQKRAGFLDRACLGDVELRRQVESLIKFRDTTVGLGGKPEAMLRDFDLGKGFDTHPETSYEGRRIGPYIVERKLGEGGMGTVVLAQRKDDFHKKVALKLIRGRLLSEDHLSRFHRERQILARFDHPNIATIHDGGTTEDGLPYFAMEYVEGEPIDRYCDNQDLSIRERLELFIQVCSAVRYAHQNLVVHRDLKPANVLVTPDGVPKLIDFGIAKPLSQEAFPGPWVTAPGSSPMTVVYASTEQISGRPITTASDIYSLGVLLFELLTGELPYAVDKKNLVEAGRVICEQAPRKPSTAIRRRPRSRSSTTTTELQPPDPSARRSRSRDDELQQLRRRLSGDLDSIVLKALRKDPRNRYESVEQFSDDIRRHLDGLPVLARDGTFTYRAGKYLRRNLRTLAAASVLIGLVLAGAWMKLEADRRVERAEFDHILSIKQTQDALREADVLSDLLKNLFTYAFSPDESQGSLPTPSEILARGEKRISEKLTDQPELLATQLEALGKVYQDRGYFSDARPLLERSLRLRRRHYNGDHPLLARGVNNLAALFYRTGKHRQAEILYREAVRMKLRLGQSELEITKPLSSIATILMHRGEFSDAEAIYQRVLSVRRQELGVEHVDVATSLLGLGTLYYVQSDFDRAEPILREALEIRHRAYGPRHTRVANARSTLGRVLHAQDRLQEAEEHFLDVLNLRRELLSSEHLDSAFSKKDLAAVRMDQGRSAVAEPLLREALEVFRRIRPDSWEIADAESLLGACLAASGRTEEARKLLQRSYRSLRVVRGEDSIYARKARKRLEDLSRPGSDEKASARRALE